MPRATWNGVVIAESSDTEMVDGDHYFPRESVKADVLQPSETSSLCMWKGTATYFHVVIGDAINIDAAFSYETPTKAAENIAGRVAFWKGIEVTD